jgi:hypothetical protein
MRRAKAIKKDTVPAAKATKKEPARAKQDRKQVTQPAKTESKKPTPLPRPAPLFIDLKQVQHLPTLTAEQQAAFDAYQVRPDLDVRKMGKKQVKDDLSRLLKPDVLTTEQVFKLARDYGIPDESLKKTAKAVNPGLTRMTIGNQLRPRIAKAKPLVYQ